MIAPTRCDALRSSSLFLPGRRRRTARSADAVVTAVPRLAWENLPCLGEPVLTKGGSYPMLICPPYQSESLQYLETADSAGAKYADARYNGNERNVDYADNGWSLFILIFR